MSFDLMLGFRQKPEHLGKTMANIGFALDKVMLADATFPCGMESYDFFDENRSRRGVRFVYHDGTYKDHAATWQRIVDNPDEIVAAGCIETPMGRSAFDEKTQQETARFLRDRYNSVLYNPQSGKIVTD